MMEISRSNNNFYMDKFNKIIELKHEKENMIKKYHEEIDLFAHEFAEMIMNPQIDKNTNTCVISVKFKIDETLIENLSDREITERKNITMVIELDKTLCSSIPSFGVYDGDEPFRKLFAKYFKEINDNIRFRTMYYIIHDMLNQLIEIPGFEDLNFKFYNEDYPIVLEIPIKNPKYSASATN